MAKIDVSKVAEILKKNQVDPALLRRVIEETKPEFVFHLAAQPLVRLSYDQPVETYAVNVMGTVNVLEAVRLAQQACTVVSITTDKCYENKEWVWGYREDEPMGGFDPYSSSKGCSELVTSAYRRSYFKETGIALASGRAGNVIGGGDWAEDRLVPEAAWAPLAVDKLSLCRLSRAGDTNTSRSLPKSNVRHRARLLSYQLLTSNLLRSSGLS